MVNVDFTAYTKRTNAMADMLDKENIAPIMPSDPLQVKSPSQKGGRKGRSKSIGPGELSSDGTKQDTKQDTKNRRKSTYVPATKSIIPNDSQKAERQAARRKTLANRRVSFAPEATLHTWDVIEFMRDPTTSTDSSDQTRRASNVTQGTNCSPFKSPASGSDPPSTPADQEDELIQLPRSPAHQRAMHKKQRRRSSGIPPMNFNNPDDFGSSDSISGSSDVSGSEDEGEMEDTTGTAMSLDMGDDTSRSSESFSSTSSSARLEAALRQAAEAAGTRGIEYDEFGDDDMSMELASEEVTNAFKPWVQRTASAPRGSADLDQENVNPFSPAFKAQTVSGTVRWPERVEEEDTGDLSMDVTRAVGGIVNANQKGQVRSSLPLEDGTMDCEQAVSNIQDNGLSSSPARGGQKRRRSTTDAGSPGVGASPALPKRRRSSIARSSMGDDTMDLTVAVGGIQSSVSPTKSERKKSLAKRRSSGISSEVEEVPMDLTQVVGGIKDAVVTVTEHTSSSFDENEELTMELTTVLGGIKEKDSPAAEVRPTTPLNQSPKSAANMTPKDQERFRDAPNSGPKKLLTPLFQKHVTYSAEKGSASVEKRRKSISPAKVSWTGAVFDETRGPEISTAEASQPTQKFASAMQNSFLNSGVSYPHLPSTGNNASPRRVTPTTTPPSQHGQETSISSSLRQELDPQLHVLEPSPLAQKVLRSSPLKEASTPERQIFPQESRKLTESIKLMSTPRKETLKHATPKKGLMTQISPAKVLTPRLGPTLGAQADPKATPARQLRDDLFKIQSSGQSMQKLHLQTFLEQANIRFMDLTATKRRLTTAPTPSKARKDNGAGEPDSDLNLGNAVVAAACTQPEHDMFQHACHELKHYISEGKKVIKQIEVQTYRDTPPLIAAYMAASAYRRGELDVQMRDMKTHARFRSKEVWYAWRSQLLDDLVKALSGIGEGMIKDDAVLGRTERILDQCLPLLLEQHKNLQLEAARLQEAAASTSEEDKERLDAARDRIVEIDAEMEEKRRILAEVQSEAQELERAIEKMRDNKAECVSAIQDAERLLESCRGFSLNEVNVLKSTY